MDMKFTCRQPDAPSTRTWEGRIHLINLAKGEMEVTARDSYFHIFCGKYCNGYYLCIPNINVGASLAPLDNTYWNQEHLEEAFPKLAEVDIISITQALAAAKDYLSS